MFEELKEDNLESLVANNDTVLVQFSAGWCGNCRIMKPKFKRFAGENPDIPFVVVDAEKFPNSRKLANVNNLPTFAVFKSGELAKQLQTNKVEPLKEMIDEATNN
ncbi:thioredoxin family protein [Sediminitomix flava]|uniref:Thiol-disulfide isomerase/thioredoxin n=1 Tax=Sediminitomix flava TaxID=379075 RepID=A0A315Z8D6_SEDFL|nr:thioredoxin family protein [Sediminitomix flava]PWJ39296.1 thiol-disulfide isomerase/thioredoxin [Sediminitomix flava]